MLDATHRRQFDLLLVWAVDRLSREGMAPTIGHLQRLAAAGVAFHSYTEPLLSTDNEIVRDIVLAVMASLAKMERQKIRNGRSRGWSMRGPRVDVSAERHSAPVIARNCAWHWTPG
jgi:DNA invertase Pin-like site-specific DNA recombinase